MLPEDLKRFRHALSVARSEYNQSFVTMMAVNLKPLIGKLNSVARQVLEAAAVLCLTRTHYDVEIGHYLAKLVDRTDTDFDLIARHFSLDRSRLRSDLERSLENLKAGNARTPALASSLVRMLSESWIVASINYGEAEIRTGHTLLALLAGQFAEVQDFGPELRRIDLDQLSANYLEIVQTSSESAAVSTAPKQSSDSMLSTRFFISYRRSDTGHLAGRVFDHLAQAFGRDRVFIDVATLQPGELYAIVLAAAIAQCDAVIAIMGKHWNRVAGRSGRRALDDEGDWIRQELVMAIEKNKRIIPCTVDGAKPPRVDELPAILGDVAKRQVFEISQNQFERDMAGLVDLLKKIRPVKTGGAEPH